MLKVFGLMIIKNEIIKIPIKPPINLWLILYTVLIQLVTKDKKPIISYLLFIDVFTGILTSFFQFQ